ncbi:hypothetical protein BGZ60DRAFT_224457 [Tricladium varicosporioides]|nr:hypothetical protein BGZ60DRAFT_224457 [Hymenoscyphus varicosporioides]
MSFGWSVGDIIAGLGLLTKFGKALREADGAKSEFQDVTETLASLEITLSFLKEQCELDEKAREAEGQMHGFAPSARTAVLQTQVEMIKKPVSRFLDEIEKYDKHLGVSSSKKFFSGIHRKSKWAFIIADKVRKLQADIATPLSTIGLLQQQITIDTIEQLRKNISTDLCDALAKSLALNDTTSTTRAPLQPAFLVPYTSNPLFVGRKSILASLKDCFGGQEKVQARAALWGLGGSGKTHIAIAVAYLLKDEHPDTSIFWVHAGSVDRFRQSYLEIAQWYQIPGIEELSRDDLLNAVNSWLLKKDSGRWFMIIDNADEGNIFFGGANADITLARYIPDCEHGATLTTTRDKQVAVKITKGRHFFEVPRMDSSESQELISKALAGVAGSEQINKLADLLDNLPLALSQAAAFIQENDLEVEEYLELYTEGDAALVELLSQPFESQGRDSGVPNAVTATWMISFDYIRNHIPRAADMMSMMAYLDRQGIPSTFLKSPSESTITFKATVGRLRSFSLISGAGENYEMHRLVQLVIRKWLETHSISNKYSALALKAVSDAFPVLEFANRVTCSQYLAHAQSVLRYKPSVLEERLDQAHLLHLTAVYLCSLGNFKRSESLARQAVEIYEALLGDLHVKTLNTSHTLAKILQAQIRTVEAKELHIKTLDRRQRVLGAEHPDTLASMASLAETYRDQGELSHARLLLTKVNEIQNRNIGTDDASTISSLCELANIYSLEGELGRAEELLQQARHLIEPVRGAAHPDTLNILYDLANLYTAKKQLNMASQIHQNVLEERIIMLGEGDPLTISSLQRLGELSIARNRLPEAVEYLTKASTLRSAILGEDNLDTLQSLLDLCFVYWSLENLEKEDEVGAKIVQILKNIQTKKGELVISPLGRF